MDLMIKSLTKRIENSKLNIAEAYIEFFGVQYKDRIIEKVGETEVLVYKNDVTKELLDRLQYLFVVNSELNDPEFYNYLEEIKQAKKYLRILDSFDKTLVNICLTYFPIKKSDFHVDHFLNTIRAFDKREKLTVEERSKLKNLFFQYMNINSGKNLSEIISKEDFQDFKEAISRVKKLKSKIRTYLKNNFDDLSQELMLKGYKKIKIYKPKPGESYCTGAVKHNKIVPICVFNLYSMSYGRESMFLHEFGHAIDSNNTFSKIGLLADGKYRFLNEALTEAIAIEVSHILRRKNQFILVNKSSPMLISKYSILVPLGKALVDNFKENLGQMKFGSEEDMYNIINKSTMEKLEELCIKAMFDETKPKDQRKEYIKEAVSIVENYKNRKNMY